MDRLETMMYNRYVMGKITLQELLKWHDEYKQSKEREVKNVA